MNDPNKRIDVNISSLLSLKAELLRKQDEVNKVKEKRKVEAFVPKKGKTGIGLKDKNNVELEGNNVEEYENSDLLDKSRKTLEAKAKFYEKMTASGGKLNSDDNCLVLFNQKKQDTKPGVEESSPSEEESSDDDCYKAQHSDEEWVEYTDCLGRTRKCLQKDLEFFKRKDTKLAENIQPRIELNQNAPMWSIDTRGSISNDKMKDTLSELTSVMSKYDQMKSSWEKKEEENVYKENVHYQDVLFDEARNHGVGYYAFSTDEEVRAKQMKALDEMREKTLNLQKEREIQRLNREKIIKERVKSAKNRQRARLGLPPIEDEPENEQQLYDTTEEKKRKKKEAKEKRRKEREEKRREEERKQHVRPWDKSKLPGQHEDDSSGSEDEWKYIKEKEPMSQEQWNEKQRGERNPEFAPPSEHLSFRVQSNHQQSSHSHTKRPPKRDFIKKNYSSLNHDHKQTSPIRNELNDADRDWERKRSGIEIPPPPTFEYYGPPSDKRSKPLPRHDLENSIEAGLKYLRDQSDKGILPTKSSWTANADY